MGHRKHVQKRFFLVRKFLMPGSFMAPFFFVLGALEYVCMVRYGWPATSIWLCKLPTIERSRPVPCHGWKYHNNSTLTPRTLLLLRREQFGIQDTKKIDTVNIAWERERERERERA